MITPTDHHRWPQSLGGPTERWNLSEVPQNKHRAWHSLVSNSDVLAIAHLLESKYFTDYNFFVKPIHEEFIMPAKILVPRGITKKLSLIESSKALLFDGETISGICYYLNTIWVNPHARIEHKPKPLYYPQGALS